MKRSILLLHLSVCAFAAFAALGCQEKPEVAFEEYGETTDALPFVENLPATFELPEAADSTTCVMREQAINSAKFNRDADEQKRREKTESKKAEKAETAENAPVDAQEK